MADKAQRVMASQDVQHCRRRVLVSVVHSLVLYGAPTWSPYLRLCPVGVSVMAAVQRRAALRNVRSYRTISRDAIVVVTGILLIDLLASVKWLVYNTRALDRPDSDELVGDNSGRQTTSFNIPAAKLHHRQMVEAAPCELNTPAESGRVVVHADFSGRAGTVVLQVARFHDVPTHSVTHRARVLHRFLHRICRVPFLGCSYCGFPDEKNEMDNNALRTLMRLVRSIIGSFKPGDLVSLMVESPGCRKAVIDFTDTVILEKERAEHLR